MGSMSTQTITEFLKARIAEDKADAETLPAWFNPPKLLAECAAKRAMIKLSVNWDGYTRQTDILRTLASVYADHPDYRQEWTL